MAEFPNLGKRCGVLICQQLDFLPFECIHCKKLYCLDHRTIDGHNCTEAPVAQEVDISKKPVGEQGPMCGLDGCKHSIESVNVFCSKCNSKYCLEHRHPFDHNCIGISNASIASSFADSINPPISKAAQLVEEIKKDIKSGSTEGPKEEKPVSAKNAATAAKLALMKLKQTAVGDTGKLPDEEKVYLRLRLPSGYVWKDLSDLPIMFSKTWSVGKCIDTAASAANLPNENNQHGKKKLRFSLPSGRVCEMDENLGQLVENGDLLNGGNAMMIYE